jgi:hypothetical protein
MIIVNAGIEFENFKKAYDETLVQLKEIQDGNISEHEFSSSVSAIINSYNSYFDSRLNGFPELASHVSGLWHPLQCKEQPLTQRTTLIPSPLATDVFSIL